KQLFVEDKQSSFIKIMPTITPFEEGIKYQKAKNYAKAWKCIKENAEVGNKDAIFWKGYYLTHGYDVVEPDPAQAMEHYKEAADYGHVEAQYRYAILLLKNLKKDDDEETKKEKCEKIIRYYKSAAENKNSDAMYSLGDIYFNGKLRVEKNEQLGLEYLKSAADLKNDKAMFYLGDLYLNGKPGMMEKNEQLGLDYLKSAADLKNEKAIIMLGGLKKSESS
ncbi:11460_t:CDS:1, partial [Dentiscutata heterogama]